MTRALLRPFTLLMWGIAPLLLPANVRGGDMKTIASFTFDEEVIIDRDGWLFGGNEEIPRWFPPGTDGLDVAVLAVIDESPTHYGAWTSQPIAIPDGARESGRLEATWEEAHRIEDGEMRITFYFDGGWEERLGTVNFSRSGTSSGWEERRFHERREVLSVPEGARTLRFSLVSGGPPTTTGSYLLDSMTIRGAKPKEEVILSSGRLVPLATWDLDVPCPVFDETPVDWVRVGPRPYIPHWSSDIRSSGGRSLALIDQDTRNAGKWVSRRFPLVPGSAGVEFSFDIRAQDLVGNWAVSLHFIRQPMETLEGQMEERVDGVLRQSDEGLSIQWARVTEYGRMEAGRTELKFGDRNPRGFWEVNQRVSVPARARSMRVSFRSGPYPEGTGLAWLDNPAVHAVLAPASGNQGETH